MRTSNVIVFGARHTKDPHDEQIQQIEAEWKSFKPTVALVEGRLGFLAPGLMDPVKNYGEMGKVNELAKKDHVPVYSWELPKETAVTRLLSIHKYTPEQIALYQILLPYFSNYRFGKPENPDRFVEEYLSRGKLPGLENTIVSVADIDKIWKRDFGQEKDWRDTSDEIELPGYLQEIGYDYSDIRDQHLAALIKHFQEKNEKVFAITGSSHAVIVEKAIQ
ncbi:hypothetical protein [Brevibacillus sp. SYSU BS000544]|uniref:hypothetical protein n=1 Tax=Brevibacillus sp. SYSU BS000544 TaxID=3416443 RepID=UPI003CE5226B